MGEQPVLVGLELEAHLPQQRERPLEQTAGFLNGDSDRAVGLHGVRQLRVAWLSYSFNKRR